MTEATDRSGQLASPWAELPGGLAPALRAELPALAKEIIDTILEAVPGYRRPLRGEFAAGIRMGVNRSLQQFVDLVEDPSADVQATRDTVRLLGASEERAGRSLETLQSAYRVGARLSWHRLGRTASAAGCGADDVQRLAAAVFLYVEDLAALTVQGYAEAGAERAGELARRRRVAADTLLAEPHDAAALAEAAARAGWTVPERLTVAVIADDAATRQVARALGPEALTTSDGTALVVVWPDPDGPGRTRALRQALDGADGSAAVGTAVPTADAHRSLHLARRCLRLGDRGGLGPSPWWADEHRAAVALGAAEPELEELARARLAPFDALRASASGRLQETLLAWLRAQGHRPSVAEALHVHPQTVRYRMNQLRELLGDDLDDPDARFELELALRAVRLSSPSRREPASRRTR